MHRNATVTAVVASAPNWWTEACGKAELRNGRVYGADYVHAVIGKFRNADKRSRPNRRRPAHPAPCGRPSLL